MLLSIPNMTPRADKVHITRDNETETWRSDYTGRAAHVRQVLLVLQGALTHGNETLAAPASVALTRDEAALRFAAGADGLQVLMLQFPCRVS